MHEMYLQEFKDMSCFQVILHNIQKGLFISILFSTREKFHLLFSCISLLHVNNEIHEKRSCCSSVRSLFHLRYMVPL